MEGWHPIETAPHDGRTVLAYFPAQAGRVARQDVIAVILDRLGRRPVGDGVERRQAEREAEPLDAAARPAASVRPGAGAWVGAGGPRA